MGSPRRASNFKTAMRDASTVSRIARNSQRFHTGAIRGNDSIHCKQPIDNLNGIKYGRNKLAAFELQSCGCLIVAFESNEMGRWKFALRHRKVDKETKSCDRAPRETTCSKQKIAAGSSLRLALALAVGRKDSFRFSGGRHASSGP